MKKKKTIWIPLCIIVLLVLTFLIYVQNYYHADQTAIAALESTDQVAVTQTGYGWCFDGPSEEDALIFYPGAKVEEVAYAPLMHSLAENGLDTCLVEMPFRLSIFGKNKAASVMKEYDYKRWYIGGHSLGGVSASGFAAKHSEDVEGVFLLGSYPAEKLDDKLFEVSIYGSEDQVLNHEGYDKGKSYAPARFIEYVIEGGNHAYFGNYGEQRGDGKATVTPKEQQEQTVKAIMKNIPEQESVDSREHSGELKGETESELSTESEPDTEPEAGTVSEPDTESELNAESEPDTEPDAGTIFEPDIESEQDSEIEPDTEPEPGIESEPDTGGKQVEVQTVNAELFEMDYIRFGHGPETFVIIPGLSVQSVMLSKDAIAKQYEAATEDYTIYVFDRRKALPDSYSIEEAAEDTAEAFRILGLKDVNLFAASQGGMIAMEIAIHHPELVKKLVLGSTSADVSGSSSKVIDEWSELARKGDTQALYDSFARAIYPDSVYEQYKSLFADMARTVTQEDLDRFIVLCEMTRGFNVLDDLDRISCPTLVLGSEDDKVLGAEASRQIADKLKGKPGCELYMYDGYGHAAYDIAPDYLERVLTFLHD